MAYQLLIKLAAEVSVATSLLCNCSNEPAACAVMLFCSELTAAARTCDPQFASGQIIMGTGQFDVVLAANAAGVNNVRSFAGDVLVDGVYPTGRPDTLLSGVIGFRRGNMRFDVNTAANPIEQNSTYSGRVTFSLYKGPF